MKPRPAYIRPRLETQRLTRDEARADRSQHRQAAGFTRRQIIPSQSLANTKTVKTGTPNEGWFGQDRQLRQTRYYSRLSQAERYAPQVTPP